MAVVLALLEGKGRSRQGVIAFGAETGVCCTGREDEREETGEGEDGLHGVLFRPFYVDYCSPPRPLYSLRQHGCELK